MKVIMTADVDRVGKKGDILDVAQGYFNNFLNPRKMAVLATPGNLKNLDAMIKNAILREKKEKSRVEEVAGSLRGQTYVIRAKCGPSGKLFGSITSADIAKVIRSATKIDVDKRKIHTEEVIKTIGEHPIELRLHPEVDLSVKLVVEAEA